MKKTITQTKIITAEFTSKEIPDTGFSKWYMNKTIEADGQSHTSQFCGIGRTADVEAWNSVEVPGWNIKIEGAYRNYAVPAAISKEKYEKMLKAELHVTEVIEAVDMNSIDSDDYILCMWNVGSHELFDFNERYIPYPIPIDYMDFVSNANYDLEAMIDKLKNSPYVIEADKLSVQRIPYYNASAHSTLHVPFHVLLNNEDFQKFQQTRRKDLFRAKKFIIKDVLGLVEKDDIKDDD